MPTCWFALPGENKVLDEVGLFKWGATSIQSLKYEIRIVLWVEINDNHLEHRGCRSLKRIDSGLNWA